MQRICPKPKACNEKPNGLGPPDEPEENARAEFQRLWTKPGRRLRCSLNSFVIASKSRGGMSP